MHRRSHGQAIPVEALNGFVVGIVNDPLSTKPWTKLKADIIEHADCIRSSLIIALAVVLSQLLLWAAPLAGAVSVAGILGLFAWLFLNSKKHSVLFLIASVLPAVSLATLAMPQTHPAGQAVVLYATLLLLAAAYHWQLKPAKTTRKKPGIQRLHIAAAGISSLALGAMAYFLLGKQALAGTSLPLAAVCLAIFGLAEEFYFRGLLQRFVRQEVGPTLSVFVTVSAFTAMAVPLGGADIVAVAFIASAVLSLLYYAHRNLTLSVATNIASKLLFVGLIAWLA